MLMYISFAIYVKPLAFYTRLCSEYGKLLFRNTNYSYTRIFCSNQIFFTLSFNRISIFYLFAILPMELYTKNEFTDYLHDYTYIAQAVYVSHGAFIIEPLLKAVFPTGSKYLQSTSKTTMCTPCSNPQK